MPDQDVPLGPDAPAPLRREIDLPDEGGEAPPMWLWLVVFGVTTFAIFYLGRNIGDFSTTPWGQGEVVVVEEAAPVEPDGEALYLSRCSNCHQPDGSGVAGVFPPVDGARWVTDSKPVIIRILLHGMNGEMVVRGETYNGNMPAWGQLSDADLAAIMTHERTSWSNSASPITAAEVAAVRTETAGRTAQWTAAELEPFFDAQIEGVAPAADPAATDTSVVAVLVE
ncbi:MAG: cytochrome c [Bacteroidota bacterium]